MAFMVPVVKKDYDIYSRSPPKNKPIVKNNGNNESANNPRLLQRQQSNSITIGLLQHKLQRQKTPQRVHSKSVNESHSHSIQLSDRHRSTSSSSSNTSSESLDVIRKMMHFISSNANKQTNNNCNENQKQSNKQTTNTTKTHWTAKIFRKRKNSLNSHNIS